MSNGHEVSFRKPRQVSVIATSWEEGPPAWRGLLSSLEGRDIERRCELAETAIPTPAASQHSGVLHSLESPLSLAGRHEAFATFRGSPTQLELRNFQAELQPLLHCARFCRRMLLLTSLSETAVDGIGFCVSGTSVRQVLELCFQGKFERS